MKSNTIKKIAFFIMIIFIFFIVSPNAFYAENDFTIADTFETKEETDAKIKKYKQVVEISGFSAKFDCEIISNPIYKKSLIDENKKYYYTLTITEPKCARDAEASAIAMVEHILTTAQREFVLTEDANYSILKFSSYAPDLTDLNFLMTSTKFINLQNTHGNAILYGKFDCSNDSFSSFKKFILTNAKFNFVIKTKGDILTNIEEVYTTNEKGYSVHKISLSSENDGQEIYIINNARPEMNISNSVLNPIILLIFSILFLIYIFKIRGE